ncbi:ABC transporter ATP-binding protein [Corynebacterium pygosceleis]|uniref:ABC transporter ATP-binding protein n=1 Tax=Corynebacterium pygosceleis TaxID=2800406 RepID=UPI002002BA69|nr:ABC transporter ATP-binding protein/permease [Corynebacterium pygosceleis]
MSRQSHGRQPDVSGATDALHVATGEQVRRVLADELRPHRVRFSTSLILLILGSALGLVAPRLMGGLVDLVRDGRPLLGHTGTTAVWWAAAAMAAAVGAMALITGVGYVLMAGTVERIIASLREQVVSGGIGMPAERIEKVGVGDLVSRTTDDVAELTRAVNQSLASLAIGGLAVLVTVVGMAFLDWRFLAVVVLLVPVYATVVHRYRAQAPDAYLCQRTEMAQRASGILTSLRGLRTVRAFNLQSSRRTGIGDHSWRTVELGVWIRILINRLFGGVNLAEYLGMAGVLVIGWFLVERDTVTVGVVTTAALYFLRLFQPIGMLVVLIDPLASAAASLRRVVGVVVEPETRPPGGGCGPGPRYTGPPELCIEHLSFSYPGARKVLDDVTARVAPGSVTAVVGASGAGKSTLGALMAGCRPVDTGRILIGGIDAACLSPEQRARTVCLVTQETHVFAGTLRDDLRLACPGVDDAGLLDALHRVGALDWVTALPDGLDTVVGERGQVLGPVEAQQIALARVLLVDPPVVVLDEATSEAGAGGGAVLEAAVWKVVEGRTAVVIAHRLDQAARADEIWLMDSGRMVERGAHPDLVEKGGAYAELWEAWSRGR